MEEVRTSSPDREIEAEQFRQDIIAVSAAANGEELLAELRDLRMVLEMPAPVEATRSADIC